MRPLPARAAAEPLFGRRKSPRNGHLGTRRGGAKGAEPGTETRGCSTCGGAGTVRRVSRNVFGQFVHQRVCPECGGAGNVFEAPCRACGGEGRRFALRELDVDIPAGIHDGQRILVRGEGNAGYRGATPGNAFVVVRVRPDWRARPEIRP